MSVEEPPYLVVGTDVSAKYRGAFCEAKVKKIVKLVKVKVTLKESGTSLMVTDEDVTGPLKVGMRVEVKNPDTGSMSEATVNKIVDSSTYTVVFDDGDENTLRRTQLCLKGDRHFVKSETLDQLPLTHPEHFGTPVMKSGKGYKRRRPIGGGASESDSEVESSDEGSPKKVYYKGRLQELVGRVVLMEFEDRKKTSWVPVLVANAGASDLPLPSKDHILVKSFKDNKFYTVNKKDTKDFVKETAVKNEDKTLKISNERAITYVDSKDLPPNWDREELLGNESDEEEQSDSSDDEPNEEKDRFVAQLYKFMDDRGTPINKAPVICNHDLNLYRLFRVVQNLGGYNKVTNQMKWKVVYSKMNLPPVPTSASQIKTAYKKYCGAFEDFYRKLGSTMGTISRPGRSRHSSGRSLLSFREREKDSPRSPKSEKKARDDRKEEKKDDKKEDEKAKPAKEADKSKSKDVEKSAGKREDTTEEQEDLEVESPRKSRSRTQEQKRTPIKEEITKDKEQDLAKPITREDIARQAREEAKSIQAKTRQEEIWKPSKPETRNTAKEEEKKVTKEEKKVEEKKLKDEDKKGSKELERRGGKDEEKKMGKEIEKRGGKEEKVVKDEKRAEKSDITEDDKPRKKPTRKKSARNEKGDKDDAHSEKKSIAEDKDSASTTGASAEHSEEDEVEVEEVKPKRECKRRLMEDEYGVGTKLKVRYGRGRNQKLYEAKIVEAEIEHGSMHYLVHYSGWNNRYDEWVQKDRIVGRVNPTPSEAKSLKLKSKISQKSYKLSKPPPYAMKKPVKPPSAAPGQSLGKNFIESRSRTTKTSASASNVHKPPRPTRSNSIDITPGIDLPIKVNRRSRRNSGFTESSDVQSHVSDSDSEDSEEEKFQTEEEHLETKSEISLDDQDNKSVDSYEPGHSSLVSVEDQSEAESETKITTSRTRMQKVDIKPRTRTRTFTEQYESEMVEYKNEIKSEVENINVDDSDIGKSKLEKVGEIDAKPVVTPVVPITVQPPALQIPEKSEEVTTLKIKTESVQPEAVIPTTEIAELEKKEEDTNKGRKKKETPSKNKTKLITIETSKPDTPDQEVMVQKDTDKYLNQNTKDPSAVYDFELDEEPATCRKELKRKEPFVDESKLKTKVKLDMDEIAKTPEKGKNKEKVKTKILKAEKIKPDKDDAKQEHDTEKEKKTETEKKKTKKKVKKKTEEIVSDSIVSDSTEDIKSLVLETETTKSVEEVKDIASTAEAEIPEVLDSVVPLSNISGAKDNSNPPVLSCSSPLRSAGPAPLSPQILKLDIHSVPVDLEELGSPPALPTLVPENLAPSGIGPDKPATDTVCPLDPVMMTQNEPSLEAEAPIPSSLPLSALSAPSTSTTVFDNTPPETPEHSPPSAAQGGQSPHSQEDHFSLRSADDVSLEDEGLVVPNISHPVGAESPNTCDTSTLSNGSGGSSGNAPSSEGSVDGVVTTKRKSDSGEEVVPVKRRKRGHKRATPVQSDKHRQCSAKSTMSDSDEANADVVNALITMPLSGQSSPFKRTRPGTPPSSGLLPAAAPGTPEVPRPPRPPKYNFNLEEGNYLEGEKRINFLQDKIQEIRKIYMSLKAEVACIDRRRKRHKRKEKEAAQQANSSQMEVECS